MIYNNLILNENLFDLLKNYTNKNLPHSFIFYGNEGVGKFGHAIEFSNLILSKNADKNITRDKIKKNIHENINFIMPLPKSRTIGKNDPALKAVSKPDIDDIFNKIKLKLKNPYFKINIDKANTILINSIRDIKKKINLSNFNNQYNIYIIMNAEKLCYPRSESANSLLKILEEPNNNNLFILITSNISQMLETLTSRCVKIFFPKLKSNDINNFLNENYNIDNKDINFIAHCSNGNNSFAIDLLNEFEELKKDYITLITLLNNFEIREWQKFSIFLKDKKKFKILLKLLLILLVDAANNKEVLPIYNFIGKEVEKIFRLEIERINKAVDLINKTNDNLKKNIHLPLLLTTFYLEIYDVLNKH